MASPPPPPPSPELQRLAQQLVALREGAAARAMAVVEPEVFEGRKGVGCTMILVVAAIDIGVMTWAMSINHVAWALSGARAGDISGPVTGLTILGSLVALIGLGLAGAMASRAAAARPRTGRARGIVLDQVWVARKTELAILHKLALVVRYEVDGHAHDARLDAVGVPIQTVEPGKPTPARPKDLRWQLGDDVELFYEPGNFGNVALERPSSSTVWIAYTIGMLMFGVIGCGMIGMALALLIDSA